MAKKPRKRSGQISGAKGSGEKEGQSRSAGRQNGRGFESRRALLRTAEVLAKTRITHQVLYRYITLGLIEPAQTTASGLRLFQPNVVQLIEVIKGLSQTGYSLRDMKDIFFKDERVKRLSEK